MFGLLAAAVGEAKIWYAIPLIVAISLVYGATRHEHVPEILSQAGRSAPWVAGFMAIIFAIVWVAGYGVV